MIGQAQFTITDLNDGPGTAAERVFYLTADRAAGVSADEPGWSRFPQQMTAERPYLWSYRVSAYAAGDESATAEVSGDSVSFRNPFDPAPLEGLTVDFATVQSGSGNPSPDNVRPIRVRTGVYLTRVGRNLLVVNVDTRQKNGLTFTVERSGGGGVTGITLTGQATAPNTFLNLNRRNAAGRVLLPPGDYVLSGGSELCRAQVVWDGGVRVTQTGPEVRFTVPEGITESWVRLQVNDTSHVFTGETVRPMLRRADDPDPAFEPCRSEEWNPVFPAEAGTVCAGTVDAAAGLLTVERVCCNVPVDAPFRLYTGSGYRRFLITLSRLGWAAAALPDTAVSSHFTRCTAATQTTDLFGAFRISNDGYLVLVDNDSAMADLAALQDWLRRERDAGTPVQVSYTLAQPLTIPLAPREITALTGPNSLWAEGDTVTVKYFTDPHATEPVLIGALGRDGVGVLAVDQEFLVSDHGDALTEEEIAGDGWTTELPACGEDEYLWTRQRLTYTADGTTPSGVGYTEPYCLTAAITQAAGAELRSIRVTVDGVSYSLQELQASLAHVTEVTSEWGSYREGVEQRLEATAEHLTQYMTFVSELRANLEAVSADFTNWRVATEGYIRSGIVDYDGPVPVYGIAIGQNLETGIDTATGDTVIEKKNFRAIYAASRLAFWQDEVEVAYVSNNQLYITNVVALSNLTVGQWSISGANAPAGLVIQWIGG